MDDDGLNMRNWVYYEPSLKGHLNLQLMPNVAERGTKSFLPGRDPNVMVNSNGAYHHHPHPHPHPHPHHHQNPHPHPHPHPHLNPNPHPHPRDCMVSETPSHMDYARDSWVNQRDKFLNMVPTNPNYAVMPEASGAHTLHMLQPHDYSKDERMVGRMDMEEEVVQKEGGNHPKKRQGNGALKVPKPKKPKKGPAAPKENGSTSAQRVKSVKKNMDVVINGIDMDISGIPIPVCSCTGTPQQCYRWGCGGWQSACCTTSISMYPLPMSTKRRGARIAGRKMSQGAFKKVLEKLAAEGYNFGNPIDLRTHWAKHGTNKFVTIR